MPVTGYRKNLNSKLGLLRVLFRVNLILFSIRATKKKKITNTTNQPIIICILGDSLAQFIYVCGPLAIILGLNVLFFILTSLKIRQIQHDMRRPSLEEKSQRHRKNLNSNMDK